MIFYYSGCGNSRFIAKEIAAALNEQLEFIPELQRQGYSECVIKEGESLGFVFPNAEYLILEKDISEEDSVKEIYSETRQRFGRVDILVNNAAADDETGNDTIETITREVIDNTFAVNVRGSLMMTREFVSHTFTNMEEPILNSHNKDEYEPAHTSEIDTQRTLAVYLAVYLAV